MSHSAPQPTAPPRSGCTYLLAAAIIGTAATMAWIGDMSIHHGVLLGAAIVAAVAGCVGVVRNSETRRQYLIDQAREEGQAVGYVMGVDAALSGKPPTPQLRSVSTT